MNIRLKYVHVACIVGRACRPRKIFKGLFESLRHTGSPKFTGFLLGPNFTICLPSESVHLLSYDILDIMTSSLIYNGVEV